MKYLKNFKHFESIETEITDEPDVKLAKEHTNDLEKALKDFPAIKTEIDKAFMENDKGKANEGEDESSDNEMLNKKIEEIKKKFPNNPFLEEYTRMMNLQLRIKHIQDELMKYNDQLFQNGEDLKLLASTKGDVSAKTKTINDIKSKQKIKIQEITDLKKDLIAATIDQKKKMEQIKKEMQDSSKKITSF